jgi:transcriptional regulator with XRE-family HTH domain
MMNGQTIAEYIRNKRKELGLSQAALAERIGRNRAAIANYEAGRAIPPGDTLVKIQQLSATPPYQKQRGTHG